MQQSEATQTEPQVVMTNGSIRPRRVDGWKENVKSAEDAKTYIKQMYPQFPDELVEAYVIVLANKQQLDQKLGKSNKKSDAQWDFMAEVQKAREKCAEEIAAENARKLLEECDLENAKGVGRGKGKRK